MEVDLFTRVQKEIKAGRHNNRFEQYHDLYFEVTGKNYTARCDSCAAKYLYGWLQLWYEGKKKNN